MSSPNVATTIVPMFQDCQASHSGAIFVVAYAVEPWNSPSEEQIRPTLENVVICMQSNVYLIDIWI